MRLVIEFALVVFVVAAAAGAEDDPQAVEWAKAVQTAVASGHYADAVSPAERLYKHLAQTLSPEHHRTVSARIELDGIRRIASLAAEAQTELQRARQLRDKALQASGLSQAAESRKAVEEALEIVERHFGDDDPYLIEPLTAAGSLARAMNDSKAAESRFQRAADLARKHYGFNHPVYAAAQAYLADFYLSVGRVQESVRAAEEAREINVRVLGPTHPNVIVALNQLVEGYQLLGEYEQALERATALLEILRQTHGPNHPYTASARRTLGMLLSLMGEFDRAELELKSAVEAHAQLSPPTRETAASYESLAAFYSTLGQFADAAGNFRLAYQVQRHLGNEGKAECLPSLRGLAAVLARLGALDEAELAWQRVLLTLRNLHGADDPSALGPLGELASICERQGRLEEATLMQRHRLKMAAQSLGLKHPLTIEIHDRLADLLPRTTLGTETVEQFLEEMVFVRESWAGGTDPVTQAARSRLGRYQLAHDQIEEARQNLLRVRDAREQMLGPQDPDFAVAQLNLAEVSSRQGDIGLAVSLAEEAANLLSVKLGDSDARTVAALTATARYRHESGNPAVAFIDRALQGRSTLSTVWESTPAPTAELPKDSLYRVAAAIKLDAGSADEALQALDQHWNQEWLGTLSECGIGTAAVIDPSSRETGRKLSARIEALNERIERLRKHGLSTEAVEESLTQAQESRDRFINGLRDNPSFVAASSAQPCDLRAIREQILKDPRVAIIGWFDGPASFKDSHAASSHGFVLRGNQPTVWERLPMGSGDAATEDVQGYELRNNRFAPLRKHLEGVSRLIVIPSATPMTQVPLESLPSHDTPVASGERPTYLGDDFEISYMPSLSALLNEPFAPSKTSQSGESLGILVIAGASTNPVSHLRYGAGSIPPVTELSERRWKSFSTRLPNSLALYGPDGSEARMAELSNQKLLERYAYSHFGNYAYVDARTPHRSALMLAQPESGDPFDRLINGDRFSNGWLDLREILGMRLGLKCATLPLCESTGMDGESNHDPFILAHALLVAGAQEVLTSLWLVEDEPRDLLVGRFYDNIIDRGMPAAKALQEAKQWLRAVSAAEVRELRQAMQGKQPEDVTSQPSPAVATSQASPLEGEVDKTPYAHPHYWAAFVLVSSKVD